MDVVGIEVSSTLVCIEGIICLVVAGFILGQVVSSMLELRI